MNNTQKIVLIRSMIDDVSVTDAQIADYLTIASSRITDRVYPFGNAPSSLPEKYDNIQCELVVRMIARRGGEGEIGHSENGINRSYDSVDDADLLSRLVPYVGVI